MNKSESKYFNTAAKMDEALITLLEKKDFAFITVREICDTAGVSRSTFYLHYESTADLLRETAQYILDKHFSYYGIGLEDVSERLATGTGKDLIFVTGEYVKPYLTFIKDNRRIFRLAVKQFDVLNMQDVYKNLFRRVFVPILAKFRIPENERPYVMKFYLSGVHAIVMEWLDGDCREDIDTVMKIICDCVLGERTVE